jgi:hypothetical protein
MTVRHGDSSESFCFEYRSINELARERTSFGFWSARAALLNRRTVIACSSTCLARRSRVRKNVFSLLMMTTITATFWRTSWPCATRLRRRKTGSMVSNKRRDYHPI